MGFASIIAAVWVMIDDFINNGERLTRILWVHIVVNSL